MHLLVLSLFPLTASLILILLNFVSWEQPSFLSLSLLYWMLPVRIWKQRGWWCLGTSCHFSKQTTRTMKDGFPRIIFILVSPGTWHMGDRRIIVSCYRFCMVRSFWSLLKCCCPFPHICPLAPHWAFRTFSRCSKLTAPSFCPLLLSLSRVL